MREGKKRGTMSEEEEENNSKINPTHQSSRECRKCRNDVRARGLRAGKNKIKMTLYAHTKKRKM